MAQPRCQAVRHHRPFTVTRAPTRTAVPSLLQSTIKTSAMACFTAPSASILSAPLCARVLKILNCKSR